MAPWQTKWQQPLMTRPVSAHFTQAPRNTVRTQPTRRRGFSLALSRRTFHVLSGPAETTCTWTHSVRADMSRNAVTTGENAGFTALREGLIEFDSHSVRGEHHRVFAHTVPR